ncbi:NADH-quinone oxidoreductase subunit L [Coxiella endosymbiont of Amblyomma nuttalli]|uniref:NADH-quinone oxidoreductase subunit L n=1 Tax=Coxiella endosymbiont of Amblyomma nuttalli TaxID=2749996 RepID=UPI001BAAB255|nr:NADH-quinone oxidoreductase subunit L [Coxiella endosymbiont of Amblyomma nuttalli]QTS83678.1 NADH-quinone oxidoreductase subunit L [Coxiella endosymbiont of Amblyomma nuttalli]
MVVRNLTLLIVLAPLLGCLIAGLGAKYMGRRGTQWITISLMTISFLSAIWLFKLVTIEGKHYYGAIYTWGVSGRFHFNMGLMVDQLTSVMMLVITFISWVVHIYSTGYMVDDPSYRRFFSYMSMFTFAMLMLVTANNFLQLFFGWEGVGLVSYLLIGFWFDKESAVTGSLKAFLVNRVGDFGFILGIAAILDYFGSLDYHTIFNAAGDIHDTLSILPNVHWSIITVICVLLFIGAMGKSAQMPLHVWLPESMEGPIPISALIHAATMVTAGVFLVARMSPLFELSQAALSTVLIVGATTALFTGILAFVEFDIKRVIAFSTMSQLGYMMAADGASAYSVGIFHLLTHACFKALLFLTVGSIIIAMHHEQDMRKMGNLRRYLPITYITFLIGALSLAAIPPFAGFYSKDAIIEAVSYSTIPGSGYAYGCLLAGAFVTGYYIFRAFFITFHTEARMTAKMRSTLKETPWNMRVPQWILGAPSLLLGAQLIYWILYCYPGLLGSSIETLSPDGVLKTMANEYHGAVFMAFHSIVTLPFWSSVLGIVSAWFTVISVPKIPSLLKRHMSWLYRILVIRYAFDIFNWIIFVRGGRTLANFFFLIGDLKLLDHFIIDGAGRNVTRVARFMRRLQSGYLYHYVFVMVLSLLVFLIWSVFSHKVK